MRKMPVSSLRPGMVLAKSVYGPNGSLFLGMGVELKSAYISGLWRSGVSFVYVEDALLNDIFVQDVVSDETRRQAVHVLKEMLAGAKEKRHAAKIIPVNARFRSTVEKLVQEVLENREVVVNLSDIRSTDDYTFSHSVNVCILTLLSCNGLDMQPTGRLDELAVGALLHDMGKVWIDQDILNKKGSLTPEEYEEIKKHPSFGYEILSHQPDISALSNVVVKQHHERCDGSGYPHNLKSEDIHPFAKLAMVADVYDALTADRPYRTAMQPHQAIDMLTGCVELYDTEMLRGLMYHLAAFPVGSAVRLSNEDLALVVKTFKGAPLRPVVRVCKSGDGIFYNTPFDIDLTERLDLVIQEVLSAVEREREIPVTLGGQKGV